MGIETVLLISALATLLGTGASMYGQYRTNQTNVQLAREGMDFEKEQVQNMNTYNSPLNQMQRLSQAGLNPRMMYGTSGGGGQQTTTAKAQVPTVRNTLEGLMKQDPLGTLQAYNNVRLTDAKILSETSKGTLYESESYIKNLEKHIKSETFGAEKRARLQELTSKAQKYPQELSKLKQAVERGEIDLEAYKSIVNNTNLSKEMQSIAKIIIQSLRK